MIGQLIDAVYNTLKKDEAFAAFFGLTPTSSPDELTKRIGRGMELDETLTGSGVPLVRIYQKPGRFGQNYLVYEGKFCLDVYAKSAAQGRQIAQRAFELFHDKTIQDETFHSFRCLLAYDADFATGIAGIKGYESIFDVDYLRTN